MRWIQYARKSSEGDERQVQSIPDQQAVLERIVAHENLTILHRLNEARSAKQPGTRPVFAEMLNLIHLGKADGILCWHLNRLSRNPVDSGQLQWLLQQGVIKCITPLIAIPTVRRTLGANPSIDLKAQLDRPGQVILIGLAVDRLHGAGHLLGGLLVSAIHNAVMVRSSQPEHRRNPVSLYIDEFENVASPAFESIIAEGRRFKLSLTKPVAD